METIKITTSQNVDIEYEAAGVGYRILATLLDGVFIGVYIVIIVLLSMQLGFGYFYADNQYLAATLMIILGLPVLLYHFLNETFMNGQSLGKKIVKIKVVKLDGTQPGIGSYILRSILRVIDIQLFNGLVALISIAASDKSQRLGDMAAGTTVIKINSNISLSNTILFKQITNYKIVFDQVVLLSDKDVGIIKEVLNHSLTNNKPDNLKALAQKVKQKMNVDTTLTDEQFLKTVLLDYSHYQFEK